MNEKMKSLGSDPRTARLFRPVRIVASAGCENECQLLESGLFQSYFAPPEQCCRISGGGWIILDYGEELSGGIRLVSGDCSPMIRLRFGESVSECCGEPDGDHVLHDLRFRLPRWGANEFGNTGFRFVRIDTEAKLLLIGVPAIRRIREYQRSGGFSCSDTLLNRIHEVAAHTLDLNCQEYLLDGIKRDRLVWQGDLHPELCSFLALYDDDSILRESFDFVRGLTPLPGYLNGISSYSLWWIICQHDLYLRRGNAEYLRSQLSYLSDLVRQLAECVGPDGGERLPEFRFFDWPSAGDEVAVHVGLQALMRKAFDCAATLFDCSGQAEKAAFCREIGKRLAVHRLPETRRKGAAAMLALAGAADAKQVEKTILNDRPWEDISTFLGFYVLRARAAGGNVPGALELIRRYWGGMLKLGATSFWEDFDLHWLDGASRIDELPQPDKVDVHAAYGRFCYQGLRHSLCHGWASGPAAFLPETLTGFHILEPGCRRVALHPILCGLEWFSCRLPTPFGAIRVEMTQNEGCQVEAPAEIEVTVTEKTDQV